MIFNSLIVLSLLELVLGSPLWNSGVYHNFGPLARRAAFTREDELASASQRAAFEIEHQRLKNKLAADHPDLIPHLSDDSYSPHNYERGLHTYDNGEYKPELYEAGFNKYSDDDGQYDPKLYEEQQVSQYDDGQYKPHLYNKENDYSTHFDDGKYRPNLYQQNQYTSPAYRPSTLNADGTVAHTPEYKAIAAALLETYQKALSRHRRSTERYTGPPAPLNKDFTVDHTPEVKHFNAAHFTAVANQFKRLHETAALAAAHPDLTSPPSKDYNPQNNQYVPQQGLATGQGQYSPLSYIPHHPTHHDDGQYRPHLYEQGQHYTQPGNRPSHHPVQLNSDGTVAHTPAYNAILGSFHAAYDQALHRHRRSTERYEGPPAPLNPDFTVDFTPEIKKVSDAHFSAVAKQFQRLKEAADFAAAHPDRTSPPSPDNKPNYQL